MVFISFKTLYNSSVSFITENTCRFLSTQQKKIVSVVLPIFRYLESSFYRCCYKNKALDLVNEADSLLSKVKSYCILISDRLLIQKAKEKVEKALRIDPKCDLALVKYASILVMVDFSNLNEAQQILKKAQEINPKNSAAKTTYLLLEKLSKIHQSKISKTS